MTRLNEKSIGFRMLVKLREPKLLFRFNQAMEDPRDGLTLFGPLDDGKPYGIQAAVIGTRTGIGLFTNWVEWASGAVMLDPPQAARPPFPGFESAFRTPWSPEPILHIEIDEGELKSRIFLDDRHQRIFRTVELYADAIARTLREEDAQPDIWFVVIPDIVWKYGRPQSVVEPELRQEARRSFKSARQAKKLLRAPSLFPKQNIDAEPYFYKEHFRNQLKARLLVDRVSTQVVRESVLANIGGPQEELSENQVRQQSQIAWTLSTAAFYKSFGRPWKLAGIRDGVCYVGLTYKQDQTAGDPRTACCAAQMFLDSGDGVVFKGAVGPWYSPDRGDYHLNRQAAYELARMAVESYQQKTGNHPGEMFLHGKVWFNREEWRGFRAAVDSSTKLVGIKIRDDSNFKLYRSGDHPVLRGMAYLQDKRKAFLWTRGYVPRLQTYPGREVPNPLTVTICRGQARLSTVLDDILALTKLNYNACIFADGKPITLKFADAVGDVLTAGPLRDVPPLPFQYYI